MVMPSLYRLPSVRKPQMGPSQQTVNSRANRGVKLSLKNIIYKLPTLSGGTGSGGLDRFTLSGTSPMFGSGGDSPPGFNAGALDPNAYSSFGGGDPGSLMGFDDGGDVTVDPYATDDDRNRQAPSLQSLLGAAVANNPATTAPMPAPLNMGNPQDLQTVQEQVMRATAAPQLGYTYDPTGGRPQGGGGGLLGGIGNFVNNMPALPGVGLAAQEYNAVADKTGLPNVPNPTLGNVFQAASLPGQAVERVPGFGSQPAILQSFERNAANLAPLIAAGEGSVPLKLAELLGGAGGQTADEKLGLPQLPVIGGPLGLAGLMAPRGLANLGGRVAESAAGPGEYRGITPDSAGVKAISSQMGGTPLLKGTPDELAPVEGGAKYPGGYNTKAEYEKAKNANTPGVLDSQQKDALWGRGGGDKRDVFRPTEDMQVTGEGLTFDRQALGLMPAEDLQGWRQEINAKPAGRTAELGAIDAQLDAHRMLDRGEGIGEYGTQPNAARSMEQIADAIAKTDNKTPHDRAYVTEMQRIYNETHAHDGNDWNFNWQNVTEAPKAPAMLPMGGPAEPQPFTVGPGAKGGAGERVPPPNAPSDPFAGLVDEPKRGELLPMGGGPADDLMARMQASLDAASKAKASGATQQDVAAAARGDARPEGAQDIAARNPYALGNIPNRDTYYNNPAVPEALRQGSPAPVGPGEGAISPAPSQAPMSAETPPHPSETANAADVGLQQGPAQDTGLKLPGGEPITAGPGQEPLQAGLPAPAEPVATPEAKSPTDLNAPRTDAPPATPRPLDEMTPQEIQAEADRLGVKVDPNVVSGLLRDPDQRAAELARIEDARNADHEAKMDAWNGNMNNATDTVMRTFRGDVDAAKVKAAAEAEKAQQDAWMGQGGGKGGSGSSGPPPAPKGLDPSPWRNAMAVIGAPTRPLLMGLHMARFGPQEAMRPGVLGNGIRALGEAMLKGEAKTVLDHVNNDLGPNIPDGFRAADMKAANKGAPVRQTYVDYAINHVPVLGQVLDRLGSMNRAFLDTIRDAHYNYAADRLARTDAGANPDMYKDLWREANNATGHSTLLKGSSTSSGLGIGWGALTARVEELGNLVQGSGAPVPGMAGSRAEAFKSLAGVASTMAVTAALGKAFGASVNTDKLTNKYGVDSTFLHPITSNGLFKTMYGTGGAGYDTLIKAAVNLGMDLGNGDFKAAEGHLGAFARGEFGVVPSGVIDALLGKTWDGQDYEWKDFINEAKTGFQADKDGNWGQGRSTPIAARANIDAIKAYGPSGVLKALPADIADEANTRLLSKADLRNNVMGDDALMNKAFPSSIAQQVKGQDYTTLAPREMAAINDQRDPATVKAIEADARSRGDPYQLAADQRNQVRDSYNPAFDELQRMLNSPKADAFSINAARNALTDQMYNDMNAVKAPAGKGTQEQSQIQQLVADYGAIGANTKDAATRQSAQERFLLDTEQKYGNDVAQRLAWNVAPQVNEHNHPLTQEYQKAAPVVAPYFAIDGKTPEGQGQRQNWLIENPTANVQLAYLYGTPLRSGEAAQAYQQQHPGADRSVNIDVGFSNTATSYRNLPASYARDVATYQSIDPLQRGDFLAQHPDLNVLLLQTGHTSHAYSLQAYDRYHP